MSENTVTKSFVHNGYGCYIIKTIMGAHCGYVAIPEGHALHGCGVDDSRVVGIDVHGGVTFTEGPHIPGPEASDWLIGFDCLHYMDIIPDIAEAGELSVLMKKIGDHLDQESHELSPSFKDEQFVTDELIKLAEQLSEGP